MRYKLVLSYDGSKFYGSQSQKDKITVLGELNKILSMLCNSNIQVIGCSRTDRGVHANYFVVHFDTLVKFDIEKVNKSLNKLLKPYIFINEITEVSEEFHARYSVKSKKYVYKINMGEYNPCMYDYVLQYNKKIDEKLLKKTINVLNGEHNFKSFTSDKNANSYIRNIKISYEFQNDECLLYFESSGFLRYMIRNIVGLILDINDGVKSENDIKKIIESCDRCMVGKPALSNGLYLDLVDY